MESEAMTFGERLRAARLKAGLGQGELAMTIGVTYETIQAWERDVTVPSRHNGRRLRRLFSDFGDIPEPVRKVVRRESMESTTVYLRHDQVEGLRSLSDERLRPVAELIREGIDLLLEDKR